MAVMAAAAATRMSAAMAVMVVGDATMAAAATAAEVAAAAAASALGWAAAAAVAGGVAAAGAEATGAGGAAVWSGATGGGRKKLQFRHTKLSSRQVCHARPRLPTRRFRSLTRSNSLIKELRVAVLLFHGSEGGFVGYMDSVRGSSPPSLHPSNEPEPQTIIPAMMCPLAAHRLKRIAISSKRLIPFFPTHDANDQTRLRVWARDKGRC